MIGELLALRAAIRAPLRPREEVVAARDRRVRALVRHAWRHVPYYRALLDSAGVHPDEVRTAADLERIPVSTKSDFRRAGLSRLAQGVRADRCRAVTTSGSTGEPLATLLSRRDARARDVVRFRALLALGVRPRDRLAIVGPLLPRRARLHERLGLFRGEVVPLSLPVAEQARLLRALDPDVLWVFPTALRALLDEVGGELGRLCSPRLVVWSAEALDGVLARRIGAPGCVALRGAYVATETGLIAAECARGGGLHVAEDRIVLELPRGDLPHAPEGEAPAVVTVLDAWAMPVLRYRIGDLCAPLAGACACGSSFARIAPPLGREGDVVQLPSGRTLSPLRLAWILQSLDGVRRFRTVQERLDRLVVQLDVAGEPSPAALDRIRREVLEALAEPVEVVLERADLSRADARKEPIFVSRVRSPATDEARGAVSRARPQA